MFTSFFSFFFFFFFHFCLCRLSSSARPGTRQCALLSNRFVLLWVCFGMIDLEEEKKGVEEMKTGGEKGARGSLRTRVGISSEVENF